MKKILCLIFGLHALLAGCKKDNIPVRQIPPGGLACDTIVIADIRGVPAGVVIDRITVQISGFDWQTIATVEAPYRDGKALLALPTEFPEEALQQVDRGEKGNEMEGYWPSTASDRTARVATLRDEFLAWDGERRVGRVYLTDWPGEGPSLGKMYIGFQWADRPFELNSFTGRQSSFSFTDCAFAAGWNVYAKITATEETIRVTTRIPQNAKPLWRFEAWP